MFSFNCFFGRSTASALTVFLLSTGKAIAQGRNLRGSGAATLSSETFCAINMTLAHVSFHYTANWVPVRHGDFVTDLGFGFTLDVDADTGGQSGAPRIYDTSSSGGLDPDLEMARQGNVLIVQQDNFTEPNDNSGGGKIYFNFDTPADIYSVQVVDVSAGARVVTFKKGGGRSVVNEAGTEEGGVSELIVANTNVRKMRVRLFQSGGVGKIKMCVPRSCQSIS